MGAHACGAETAGGSDDNNIGYPFLVKVRSTQRSRHAERMRDQDSLPPDAPRDVMDHSR